jgi:hypothetical protein
MGTLVTGIPILPYDLFLLSTDHFLYNKKSTKIADPCLCLLDPDTAIFVIDYPEKPTKNYRIFQRFYYFLLMIEGSGSIPLTSGS